MDLRRENTYLILNKLKFLTAVDDHLVVRDAELDYEIEGLRHQLTTIWFEMKEEGKNIG